MAQERESLQLKTNASALCKDVYNEFVKPVLMSIQTIE